MVQAGHVRLHAHRPRLGDRLLHLERDPAGAEPGSWNILVGFGIMFIGFLMTTRWR
ncbi:cell division protein CrgA [Sphingomonas sp. LR61]|uniref:cell division protein CrgA n=1 Tax=Sphingomonas sp. LR61 TaxID=3050234 RepID=UPI003FA761DC